MPSDRAVEPDDRFGRAVDYAFLGLAVVLLYAMVALPGYETVPYHLLFVMFAAVYGFRIWSLRVSVALLGGMVLATGVILTVHWAQGMLATDELSEIALMPLILGAMVWHARRRAAAQRQLEQLAQYERDRRVREHEFARDTSHALRTPLTIARGHVELIHDADVRASVRHDADVALKELDRMSRMASRLLAIAELERPDTLHRQPTDVAALVRATHARWSASVRRRWSLQAPLELCAEVDEDVVRIALDALVENAVVVTAKDSCIELSCTVREDQVVLGVADSGPGIPAAETELVFQRFWRSARKREGTGLGLSYVAAAAEAHGGGHEAGRSAYGGALVAFRLPLRVPEEIVALESEPVHEVPRIPRQVSVPAPTGPRR